MDGKVLEQESAFYREHRDEYHEQFLEKWLVIAGASLWGVFDTLTEAAKAAFAKMEPGTFMIHRPADDDKILEIGPIIELHDPKESQTEDPPSKLLVCDGELISYPYG